MSERKPKGAERDNAAPGGTEGGGQSMPAQAVIETVGQIAEPLCETQGMELVHVEYHREPQGLILRIYIDKPGGVKLDDCVRISRELTDLLDVHLELNAPYNLEVSSPGTDRPLSKENDYERFKGEVARIRTSNPINGRRNFKGVLLGVTDGEIRMQIDTAVVSIPLGEVAKGRLVNYNGDNRC